MNKLYLLTKPCQSGKTQKTFEFILNTREKNYINIIFTNNSLIETTQTKVRKNAWDEKHNLGKTLELSCQSEYKDAVQIFEQIMTHKDMCVIACTNKTRFNDLTKIILFSIIHNLKNHYSIYIDEADKIFNKSGKLRFFVDLWKRSSLVKKISFITATPRRIFRHYGSLNLYNIKEAFSKEHYNSLKDCNFIINDSFTNNNIENITEVLVGPNKPEKGQVWYIPASREKGSHHAMKELLIAEGMVVLIINGEGYHLHYPNKHREIYKTDTLSQDLGIFYKNHKLHKYPLVITGKLCISRGATITSMNMFVSHCVLPDTSNKDSLYQLAGRVCGNTKLWDNYKQVTIICNTKTMDKLFKMEGKVVSLLEKNKKFDNCTFEDFEMINSESNNAIPFKGRVKNMNKLLKFKSIRQKTKVKFHDFIIKNFVPLGNSRNFNIDDKIISRRIFVNSDKRLETVLKFERAIRLEAPCHLTIEGNEKEYNLWIFEKDFGSYKKGECFILSYN
tara:strand:+ start:336 stop:1847 length:1512 start_codon:yes stop_codon:yes gene_type:complete